MLTSTTGNPSPVEDEDAYYEDADKNYPLTRINGPSCKKQEVFVFCLCVCSWKILLWKYICSVLFWKCTLSRIEFASKTVKLDSSCS